MGYVPKLHRPDILSKSMICNYHNASTISFSDSGTCILLVDVRITAIAESGITNPYNKRHLQYNFAPNIHTIAIIIVQSSIPGFRLFILDKRRKSRASKARDTPTMAVMETVLVLSRIGRLQMLSVMDLVANGISHPLKASYRTTY